MRLLSRYAECIFWMARYMERAENLARILDVHETFDRDAHGAKQWLPILRLNADEKRFFEHYDAPTPANVIRFYVLDEDNPTSIRFSVRAARENARTLRPWISTEMWTQINVFYNHLSGLKPSDVETQRLSALCALVKEAAQTHTGITEGTFYRDQGWYFYQLGKYLERADQTTRLIDVKYHLLLPSAAEVGSPLDVSQWNTLLRSAAGYHAFRRVYPRGMTPSAVAGFLLFDQGFPRSVSVCVRTVNRFLTEMKSRYHLRGGDPALEVLDEILAVLISKPIDTVIHDGSHQYLDWLQIRLADVAGAIGTGFFGWPATPLSTASTPLTTAQRQSA
jgi:uncharacterized alpha-E superfamily protein